MNMSKRNILRSIILVGVALFLTTTDASCDELWSRAFMGTPAYGPFRPFNVVILESVMGNHLMAICSYANYIDGKELPRTVSVKGVKTKDGKFCPRVTAKVTNDVNGGWKTIGELGTLGKPAARRIAANNIDHTFTVPLDIFPPFVGKFLYGSLVLKTGQTAVFELNDLLPPEQEAPIAVRGHSDMVDHLVPANAKERPAYRAEL